MAAHQARSFGVAWPRLDAGPARVAAMISALVDRLEKRPGEAFALFCLGHAALWTLLPAALYPNLPLDLIEALTYGREWQLGYDKLPPLPWWLIEGTYRLFGSDTALYLVAQVTVVVAFGLVWVLARRLVGPLGALVAVLIVDGLHYFNFTAPKFNHDVIQLPLWALAGVSFHGALRSGRLRDWAGLGLACGLALWAKYFIVVLALPLALFLLLDRDARRALKTPGPYVAVLVGLCVALPHMVWLVQNDFLPFRYADARAAPVRGILDHVVHPLVFVVGQIVWLLPSGLIALPFVDPRYRASLFPGDRLGAEISTRFRAATGAPLAYVIGSMWLGGNISRYSVERPRTLIDAKPERAPWIDLADLKRRGAVVVWTDGDRNTVPEPYARFAAGAQVQPPLTLPMRWGSNGEMLFGWAIVPPAP